jgi:HlyD family secretion protein
MNKRLRIVLVVLVVLLAIALVYRYWYQNNNPSDHLTLYGNVDLREVQLAFVLQERIANVKVEEGDQVQAGQVLAEVDPVRYQQAVAQHRAELEAARQQLAELEHGSRSEEKRLARAELASAQAAERNALAVYRRAKQLVVDKLTSQQQADDAKAAFDMARANSKALQERLALVEAGPREEDIAMARAKLEAAQAALARARKDLDDTRLRAPAAGVIQARILQPGDLAGPQQPVFTLALLDPLWVRAYVSEPELGQLHQGMTVRVHTDSFPDKFYQGRVGYISPTAEFTPKSVQTTDVRSSLVYQVRVLVPDPQGELRLGMPATVTVPLSAVQAGADDCD